MRHFFLSVWLCLAFSVDAATGKSLSGVVKDSSTGGYVSFANVMAYALPDSALIGFAVSDDSGSFLIDGLPDNILLKVTCLGYKTSEMAVSFLQDSTVFVSLEPEAVMLKNVVVKGRMPGFKVHGDTIDYNFQKYTDGSERVLKDILAKLPGMDVDDKGQVTANGQAVKKILVNGQDFFGEHNEQITNNLPSDYVDKIQLQKNYSEYSFVEGFKTHKSTALNVTIDSVHLGNITGNAELYGGYCDKYRMAANLYSFGGNLMWGVNAKFFNTGEEMMTLMDYIKLLGGVKDYAKTLGGTSKIIDNGLSAVSYINNSINTYSRTNGVASANIAWNPNEHVKINAYYLFNLENSKGQYDITRTYFGKNFVENTKQIAEAERGFHHVGINMKNTLKPDAALDWRFNLIAAPQNSQNKLGRYAWDEDMNVWNVSNNLAFVKNWYNRNLLSVSSQLAYNNNFRAISVEADDSLLFMPNQRSQSVSQVQRTTLLDHNLAASWTHRLSKAWQFRMSAAWNLIRSTSSISPYVAHSVKQKDKDLTRLYDYGLSLGKNKGRLRFDAGIDLAYIDQIHTTSKVAVLPNASIELALSTINAMSLTYSSGYERDDNYFAHGTVINDYRQLTVFDGKTDLLHLHHNLTFSSHYFNILSDFTWIMNIGCSLTEKPYIRNYDNAGNVLIASLIESNQSDMSQHAYFNIKKGFRFPLILSFKSTLVNSRYQSAYNNRLSKNRHSQAEGEISMTTKFKYSLVNAEMGYRFTMQQSKLGLSGSLLNMMSYELYLRPFVAKKGKWDVSVPLTYVHDQSGSQKLGHFDCSVQGSYTAGFWSFFVKGDNLLNTRCVQRISIDATSDYMETVVERRLPGYIIVGIKRIF
ncbi:carboxypeptidase-like regulatory domain-containing protein [Prevotella sp. MA2016]|uniref:carboxypeptidase-like regulatory domain-containing protein n=1 Tax=Prevotella sp. MA2016 TaxID=1408310 RepID=UPI000490E926|nr:carboxypeptidase-like regulatory domain-containing protein [Prevotella sp. MA2016]